MSLTNKDKKKFVDVAWRIIQTKAKQRDDLYLPTLNVKEKAPSAGLFGVYDSTYNHIEIYLDKHCTREQLADTLLHEYSHYLSGLHWKRTGWLHYIWCSIKNIYNNYLSPEEIRAWLYAYTHRTWLIEESYKKLGDDKFKVIDHEGRKVEGD